MAELLTTLARRLMLPFAGLLMAAGLALGMAGCNRQGAAPATASSVAGTGPANATSATLPVTITALVWAPDWPKEMHDVASAFTRLHPGIKVDVQFMIGNSVEENLKPKVAANQLPDLVSVNPNMYAAGLAEQGLLADVGRSAAWGNMLDLLKPDWTSPTGKHFGVAGGVAATMIYYNKAMFRQAGIDRLPVDFDEFLAVCARLKQAGYTPLVLDGAFPNMLGNGPFSAGFANSVAAGRPGWRAELAAGRLDLDTPQVAGIFERIKLLAERGYLQPGYLNTGYDDGIKLFAQGRAAMAFEGSWAAGRLMMGGASGVFVPPWNAPGQVAVPVIGSETGFAVVDTPNRAAALLFLDFLLGQGFPLQQNARHNIAPMKAVPQPVVSDAQVSAYIAGVSAAPQSVPPYYVFLPAQSIDLLHPLLQQVLSGKTTPREAAHRLDASVRAGASAISAAPAAAPAP